MKRALGYHNGQPLWLDLDIIDDAGHLLRIDAALSFRLMCDAAAKDGIALHVNTAFRDAAEQRKLYTEYESALRAGQSHALVAKPGFSNHQSGIAVDINRAHDDAADGKIDGTGPTDRWLAVNAAGYGFYRTIPSEPWHWEFRGAPKNA